MRAVPLLLLAAAMSAPRPVFKNVTLMLTRRVHGRQFRLRPSELTNRIVGYVVAVMQARWNIQVHALIVLSNHWHVVLTDPDGNIVEFQHDCHQTITRALNAHYGDFDSMWANEQGNRVECEGPDDIVSRIAYTMANPVEAGLVRYGRSWPGLRRAWPQPAMVFARPPKFFRGEDDGGDWPETATLELTRPPGFDHLSDDELAAHLTAAIDAREQSFRDQFDKAGRRFLGRRKVLDQSRYRAPTTREDRFRRAPTLACRNKWRRIERLQDLHQWRANHEAARQRWLTGDRDVIFPAGTYLFRVLHNARCADPPT